MGTEKEKDISQTSSTEIEEVENPLADMPPKMQRFLHLYMTGQYSVNKLAQLLEVHPNTLHNWLRRGDVKNAIQEAQQVTHEVVSNQMKAMTLKAMERMRDLMDSPIDGVALQAVKDVLDRSGHKAKQEIKKEVTVKTFEEKLNDIIDDVIDVDYEEVDDE
jgi:transposase-like protein